MPDLIPVFIPLAALMIAGFILGRLQTVDLKTVGFMAIYCFTPIVGFGGAAQLDVTPSILLLPLVTFAIASIVGISFFYAGQRLLPDKSLSYLLPIATGSGNTGYLGFPIAMALFGQDIAGTYLVAMLGVTIFESTIGYYFIHRGTLSAREALGRVAKLPLLYALVAGLTFSASGFELPLSALKLWEMAKGAYVCVGMMIVGIALAQQKRFTISLPLLGIGMLGKFILWPLMAFAFVSFDRGVLGLFTESMQNCILLISVAPMAANLAAYAAQNNLRVDQAAGLILITTILAVIGLPFILPFLIN